MSMPTVLLIAKVLSAATLLALLAALVHLRRRADVPAVTYGGLSLTRGRMKAIWVAFLVGSVLEASGNDPVLVRTSDSVEPATADRPVGSTTRYSLSLPFPFYRYERERVERGGVVEEHVLEGLVLPWSFMTALFAFYVLVVRWNADSRWARQILEGKKKADKNATTE